MTQLSAVWEQVKYLLSENISLIPVRDKPETEKNGTSRPAKTPYTSWVAQQKKRLTEKQLWDKMAYYDTSAIAIIAGEISGNLEIIDIDVKYKSGIDALLFKSIQSLYPAIYDKLRIHKSPSGGYHILYCIHNHQVPESMKLAARPTTQQEQDEQTARGARRPLKIAAFIETRGEGGYALAPPSMGYSIHKENPIPQLTWEERESVIALCKSYTEVVKTIPVPKPPKAQEDQYTTNPFEDYNSRTDICELLAEFDWCELREDHQFIWFTRPGKDTGVSASWNKEKEIFYVFTSSTEFEPEKGYRPATILSLLKFGGDKKKTYKYLTEKGYGVFKPYYEEKKLKREVINKGELPANFSQESKDKFETLKTRYEENLPYGKFWTYSKDRFEISREELYQVAFELGYRLYNRTQIVRIESNLIHKHTDKEFYDGLKNYIWEEEARTYTQICNAFEAFIQKAGAFTIGRLKDINKSDILQDTQFCAYKYFSNGILKITDKTNDLLPYAGVQGLLWAHKIYNRPWTQKPVKSVYTAFLENAVGITPYLKRIIGYLSHDHKSESAGYLVVLTEKTVDPKDGGGSGKNIFGNILSGTIAVKTVPGSSIKFDDKFLAAWNYERVYFLADIPKKIDWLFLKEMVTGTGYVNKKYVAEFDVPAEEMPKLLLNTNYSYDDVDGGLKRRIRQVEFTDYYTAKGGVDTVHGKMFPADFTKDDWTGYDQFIVESIQELFKARGKIEQIALSDEGWTKKFNMKHHESMYEFITDHIEKWCKEGFASNGWIVEQYNEFCRENTVNPRYKKELASITTAIKEFCIHHGIRYENNHSGRSDWNNGEVGKGKKFGPYTIDIL